ncbi:MAG: hypothetical protein QOJ44_2120 [Acidimicrobiaceae bacterium]|jgi:hypothetical protein|nr:hypothetical protein [Acidimicrobiaceae bacterium]
MIELCRAHRPRVSEPYAGELQLRFVVHLEDHPMVGFAAGNVLLLLLEELRVEGIVVYQVRLEMDR